MSVMRIRSLSFLTYRDNLKIRTLIEGYIQGREPEYDFVSRDGVGHTLWVIDDNDLIKSLCGLFDQVPDFYIADGHHRSASACKVGELETGGSIRIILERKSLTFYGSDFFQTRICASTTITGSSKIWQDTRKKRFCKNR